MDGWMGGGMDGWTGQGWMDVVKARWTDAQANRSTRNSEELTVKHTVTSLFEGLLATVLSKVSGQTPGGFLLLLCRLFATWWPCIKCME